MSQSWANQCRLIPIWRVKLREGSRNIGAGGFPILPRRENSPPFSSCWTKRVSLCETRARVYAHLARSYASRIRASSVAQLADANAYNPRHGSAKAPFRIANTRRDGVLALSPSGHVHARREEKDPWPLCICICATRAPAYASLHCSRAAFQGPLKKHSRLSPV